MDLKTLFSPRSIAVVGASTKAGSVGNSLTENLIKGAYRGKVFPVNPKAGTLFGVPCYPSFDAVPEPVDVAIIIIPAPSVPSVLERVGQKGTRAAIIISSGFKETGPAGEELERQIVDIARRHDLALLGPNCLGYLHPKLGLNASFAKFLPPDGPIAFFSQSGALCTALLDLARGNLGFSYFVSTGNKAVLDEKTLLDFFSQEKNCRLIGFYTEDIKDGAAFIKLGKKLVTSAAPKLAIGLKSGMTRAGTEASSSHTGSLAGSAEAYRALFRQGRVTRAETLSELLDYLTVFSKNPLPRGKRLAVVTNAGGLGVLATDAASLGNLELSLLSSETSAVLRSFLPAAASVKNPVDVLGDADGARYARTVTAVIKDDNVDMLLVIVTPQTTTQARETAQAIAAATQSGKPVVAVLAGADSLAEGTRLLSQENVATLAYPEAGVKALAAFSQAAAWCGQTEKKAPFEFPDVNDGAVQAIFRLARRENRLQLTETEVKEVLSAYGFPLLSSGLAATPAEAKTLALHFGGPAVLKIVSPDIIHKSEVGGVSLNVPSDEVQKEYRALLRRVQTKAPQAKIEGVLVMEMARAGGKEMILGIKKEPGLGHLLALGLGGIYVETLKDLAYRFVPVERTDAKEMAAELKSSALLSGTRGELPIDTPALLEYIGRLSRLVSDFPMIAELDINPLLVFPKKQDFAVLDARIRLAEH